MDQLSFSLPEPFESAGDFAHAEVPESRCGLQQQESGVLARSQRVQRVEFLESSAKELANYLVASLGRSVALTITDNRSTMLTTRDERHRVVVRLHRMFLRAPDIVWQALAHYLACGQKDSGRVLDSYIESQLHTLLRVEQGLRSAGRHHDLGELFEELNAEFFHGASVARVTWGRGGSKRRRASIQLGVYVAADDLIRIHPCLDQSFVPREYVGWVLFHEMLHEAFGVEERNGRRHIHPPAFVALEETYPHFEVAKAWETVNMNRLLRFDPERPQ